MLQRKFIKILLLMILFTTLFSNLLCAGLNYSKILKNNKANKLYKEGKYEDAKKIYQETSINHPDDSKVHFNLGDAYYQEKDYEKALIEYDNAIESKKINKSNIFYNIGNTYFQKKDFTKALDNYKQALIQDPNNEDAKYNYELTKRLMQKKQNKQEQQDKDKKEQQNKDKKEENKQKQQQNKSDKKQQEKQKEENKDKEQKKGDKKDKGEQKKVDEKKMDQAKRLLKAMQRKEDENQKERLKKLLRESIKPEKIDKNW